MREESGQKACEGEGLGDSQTGRSVWMENINKGRELVQGELGKGGTRCAMHGTPLLPPWRTLSPRHAGLWRVMHILSENKASEEGLDSFS